MVDDDDDSYKNVPDSLMGFSKDESKQKGYDEHKYKHEQPVRVVFSDGDEHVDVIKGMNKKHALARAKRNWPGAKVYAEDNED